MAELEQPLWSMAKHKFALPSEYRLPGMDKTALFEFNKALEIIEKEMANKTFLLGEIFYGCDILIGHTLQWARSVKVLDESHPNTFNYMKRLNKRKPIDTIKPTAFLFLKTIPNARTITNVRDKTIEKGKISSLNFIS